MGKRILLLISILLGTSFFAPIKNKAPNFDIAIKKAQDEEIITIKDISDFLITKNEHYPLSDEFMEKYQQTSGGYIDYAKKLGVEVNKYKHEPNQKWHFFTSWLEQSLNETKNPLTYEDDARDRVYSKLLCPELLLWIYEACGVSPSKVKLAKEVAEQGKIDKLYVSSIAKNMRAIVSWDDLKINIDAFKKGEN